ncbi:MAG: D-alanyl-D-alanine carboxypeptidase family protein [Candidatus Sumerlaeia bacterium]
MAQNPEHLTADADMKQAVEPATGEVPEANGQEEQESLLNTPPVTRPEADFDEWLVLSQSIQPYRRPDLESARLPLKLAYPEIIQIVSEKSTGSGKEETVWLEFRTPAGESAWLPKALLVPHIELPAHWTNIPIGEELVDRHTPLPLDYKPDDLDSFPARWVYVKDRDVQMREKALEQAILMFEYARTEGIHLRVVSGFRSAGTQRYLYLRKIEKEGLHQNVVAKPGHSEHQLGTTMDVSGLDPQYVLRGSFGDSKEGKWVGENCERFGFRISYTPENSAETGYIPEPWHLRYVGISYKNPR